MLPEEVVASLAGQLADRVRSGEPAVLTGPGGLLTGVIGQVLQAGLAAEFGAHPQDAGDGDGGANRRNGSSAKTLHTEVGPVRGAAGPFPDDREQACSQAGAVEHDKVSGSSIFRTPTGL